MRSFLIVTMVVLLVGCGPLHNIPDFESHEIEMVVSNVSSISLSTLCLTACTLLPQLKTEHVVMVDQRGNLVDPRANIGDPDSGRHIPFISYPLLEDIDWYFTHLFQALDQAPTGPDGKRRITIFLHGGLNTPTSSLERAVDYSDAIIQDGSFPIFINWDSSLTSSYIDHLFYLRQGRSLFDWCCSWAIELGIVDKEKGILKNVMEWETTLLTTPLYFAIDVVRGALRLPLDLWSVSFAESNSSFLQNFCKDCKYPPGYRDCSKEVRFSLSSPHRVPLDQQIALTKQSQLLICEDHNRRYFLPEEEIKTFPIIEGQNSQPPGGGKLGMFRNIVTMPTQIASTLAIDMAGTGSWSAMRTRTMSMFHSSDDYQTPGGGVSIFLNKLRKHISLNGGKAKWEVTLIGHSMGAIVANEMIRRFGHPLSDDESAPFFDRVVYMAAACSLADYMNTISPYLAMHKNVRMYHLMLNDQADSSESYGTVAMHGSLLVWIDSFFGAVDSPFDMVAGRYINFLRVAHLHEPEIRSRVSIKVFNYGEGTENTNPQTHGDFGNFPFWKPAFWEVDSEAPFSLQRLK